jgi:hypothetical protein
LQKTYFNFLVIKNVFVISIYIASLLVLTNSSIKYTRARVVFIPNKLDKRISIL